MKQSSSRRLLKRFQGQLTNTHLSEAPYLIGMDYPLKVIGSMLVDGKDDTVRMMGILGMAGIGKTTIAKAIYNKFYHNFEKQKFSRECKRDLS